MSLYSYNKEKHLSGIASFNPHEELIKVYEGNPNGSNDVSIDYKTFIKNYSYRLGYELDSFPIIEEDKLIMNKKKISRHDFDILINGEKIAFEVYKNMVKKNNGKEFVDIIANSYCDANLESEEMLDFLDRARYVLAKDYGVDMLELQFRFDHIKDKVRDKYVPNIDDIDEHISI